MKLDKEQFEELCSAYAVGALDKTDEKILFENLAGGSEDFQKIFTESINVSFLLNQSVIRAVPSLSVKMAILRRIGNQAGSGSSGLSKKIETTARTLGFGSPRFGFLISFFMAVIIVEIGVYAYMLSRDVSRQEKLITVGEQRLIRNQQDILSLQSTVKEEEDILTILQSPAAQTFIVESNAADSRFHGKIVWEANRKTAILFADGLPPLRNDEVYQLWVFNGSQNPVSAGIFQKPSGSTGVYLIRRCTFPPRNEISTLMVTREVIPGANRPGTHQFIVGSLK